jgi:hypothetical protein
MIVRKGLFVLTLATLALAIAPTRASADWYLTPFVGGNFGGNANFTGNNDFEDEVERRVDLGASLGWMGNGIAGVELDWGWSPNFFQNTTGPGDFVFGDSNLTTFMGNLVIGVPVGGQTGGGVRPYLVGGAGLLRSNISATTFFDDVSSNDWGADIGGGVHGYFNDNVGLRGDLRYFRLLGDKEPNPNDFDLGFNSFNFWRATLGVTFRFGN